MFPARSQYSHSQAIPHERPQKSQNCPGGIRTDQHPLTGRAAKFNKMFDHDREGTSVRFVSDIDSHKDRILQ
jgi:hypothetical protein